MLIHLSNLKHYEPKDRVRLMGSLRALGLRIINVRVASNHVEVDVNVNDLDYVTHILANQVGPVLGIVNLSTELRANDPFRSYVDLFNDERFWEAHEILEPVWRVSRDTNVQGLIIAAAAFVKIQENYIESFLRLANRALSMVTLDTIDCIDALAFRRGLREAMVSIRPFKARCIN